MPTQDTSEIKNKIISIIKQKGPSLPISIGKEAGINSLFASAFLSELLSEKKVRMSNMKVGSSSIFFLSEQEPLLANFSNFLKSKEREAFMILKDNRFLKDSEQEPAIRVALREIKDFAVPLNMDGENYWRYFTAKEEDLKKVSEVKIHEKEEEKKKIEAKEYPKEVQEKIPRKETTRKSAAKKKTTSKNSRSSAQNEKFLEKIREILKNSYMEILGIESMGKNELVLKVRKNLNEILVFAYGKKRITEKEIIKAGKKAKEMNMNYSIISLGKLPKKVIDLAEAIRGMISIEEK